MSWDIQHVRKWCTNLPNNLIQKCLHKVILFLSQAHCYFSRNNPKLVNTGLEKHAMCVCITLRLSLRDSCKWIIKSCETKHFHNANRIEHKSDGNEWRDWVVLDEAPQASSPKPWGVHYYGTGIPIEARAPRTNESNSHKTLRVTDPGDVTRLSPASEWQKNLSFQTNLPNSSSRWVAL